MRLVGFLGVLVFAALLVAVLAVIDRPRRWEAVSDGRG